MRVILSSVLFLLTSIGVAQWDEDSITVIDLQDAAEWALDQPDAKAQAAGLLLQFSPSFDEDGVLIEVNDPVDLLAIEWILGQTGDPTVLAMVAAVCRLSGQLDHCTGLGLEQLILQQAPGNLMLRSPWLGDDLGAWTEAIMESHVADDHALKIGEKVFHALEAYASHKQLDVLPAVLDVQAMIAVQSSVIPAYSPLIEACKSGDEQVRNRCEMIARDMIESGEHLLAQLIGGAVFREMATARGDTKQAEAWERRQEAFRNYMTCLSSGVPNDHWESASRLRPGWIEYAAQHGELAQMERLAERYGVRCDMTPAQARTAQVMATDIANGDQQ